MNRLRLKHGVDRLGHFHVFLASEQFGQLCEQGLLRAVEHAQHHGNAVGVLHVKRFGAAVFGETHHLIVRGIVHAHGDIHAFGYHDKLGRFDARLSCLRIGAHESARAQKHAAEIACDHHGDVGQTRVLNHLEGGKSRSLLRLSIVRVANASGGTRPAFAQNVGVHVMPRHAVGGADFLEKRQGLLFGFDMRDAGDEAALLLFDFGRCTARYGGVRTHAPYYSTHVVVPWAIVIAIIAAAHGVRCGSIFRRSSDMANEGSFEASQKRSDEIRADLAGHPEKYTMLTGDRPTGRLHLGHYFGTLKGRVELQDMGVRTNILIADYQVITDRDTTEHIQDNVYNMVMDYLACGIDPEKTMIYTHSAVPACNQLMLPFLSLVTEAELQRNPTVKAEMEASGHELTGLLLTYPVHQACDILFCKGNVVPVGRDQLPHIELTRTIARRFNNRYGKVFPEVDALLSDTPLLPGLDGRKMSKSYGNAIAISMTAEETTKRIKKSQTDSERMITFDPENRPGVSGLISTAAICTGRSELEIAEEIGMGGSGALKKYVTEAVNEYFAPIRERRAQYENDLDYIKDVLNEGNKRANEIANQTLAEVQEAMGMVY